jgi:hypothetical protein
MITLEDDDTTITLHDDLFWSDEHGWNMVEQTSDRTITGALVVQASAKVAGRPITLTPENDSSAWMSREVLDQLRNFATVPGKELTLTLRGEPRAVIFRHHDGIALDARPVVHFNDVEPGDWYLVTLRLMEV